MFPNCIDRFGHEKRETKVQQTNKQRKTKEINKQIKNGNKNLRNGWKGDLEFSAR